MSLSLPLWPDSEPLSPTAESSSVDIASAGHARELGHLHQLIYDRGGIHDVNAAIDEIAKLMFLVIADRTRVMRIFAFGRRAHGDEEVVRLTKKLFVELNNSGLFTASSPVGVQPVWPDDEPFRLSRGAIIRSGIELIADMVDDIGLTDKLGLVFDTFLQGRYSHSGGLGSYMTPSAVVDLMTEVGLTLSNLSSPTWRFLDPCCGTGRFVTGTTAALFNRHFSTGDIANMVTGVDVSSSSVAKARVNLLSYGIRRPRIWRTEDSITDGAIDSPCVDLILTNPPFGDNKYGSSQGIGVAANIFPEIRAKPNIDPALAFLARCLQLLGPGGVLGVVLPDGVLDGRSARSVLLSERYGLECLISLPSTTFALSGTVAKTTVAFIRNGTPATSKVAIAAPQHVGFKKLSGRATVDPSGNDLIACSQFIRQPDLPPTSTVKLVRLERSALHSLSVANLVSDASSGEYEKSTPADDLLTAVSRGRATVRDISAEPFVSVLHVDHRGLVDWIAAAHHRPSTPGLWALSGDIIISLLNPARFRATVIPDTYGRVACSSEFGVFRANEGMSPFSLLAILYQKQVRDQLAPLGRGTSSSRRRISTDDIGSLRLPEMGAEQSKQLARVVEQALKASAVLNDQLQRAYDVHGGSPFS